MNEMIPKRTEMSIRLIDCENTLLFVVSYFGLVVFRMRLTRRGAQELLLPLYSFVFGKLPHRIQV